MKKKQKILVTGGAGYIGSHTALALLDQGYDVVILDNLSTGFHSLIPQGADFVKGDVCDRDTVIGLLREHRPVAVMHFAASLVVEESVKKPLSYYQNNLIGTMNLLDACRNTGIESFIFSSTAAVYGDPDKVPVAEDAKLAPINPYGHSKMMAEQIIRDTAATTDLKYMILRYFNVAGADEQGRSGQMHKAATHLIYRAVKTALGQFDHIKVFGDDYPTEDGTCVRDYIHVSDLANAHVTSLEYLLGGGPSDTLNCGYGTGYSVRKVLDTVGGVAGQPLNVIGDTRRAGDPAQLVADNRKIMETLNWAPKYNDLDVIVKSALEWEKNVD